MKRIEPVGLDVYAQDGSTPTASIWDIEMKVKEAAKVPCVVDLGRERGMAL